jgi:hypothetical protein
MQLAPHLMMRLSQFVADAGDATLAPQDKPSSAVTASAFLASVATFYRGLAAHTLRMAKRLVPEIADLQIETHVNEGIFKTSAGISFAGDRITIDELHMSAVAARLGKTRRSSPSANAWSCSLIPKPWISSLASTSKLMSRHRWSRASMPPRPNAPTTRLLP